MVWMVISLGNYVLFQFILACCESIEKAKCTYKTCLVKIVFRCQEKNLGQKVKIDLLCATCMYVRFFSNSQDSYIFAYNLHP